MKIKESAENYLETILMLGNKNKYVRSVDVANELGFSKASVSVAMKSFREEGYIVIDQDGGIALTEKGLHIAERMCERHNVIARALMAIGVSEENAYADSCKIEHDISEESFEKIKEFLSKND
ncbi:MAG: metal-dependent transcriptional regulator [Ruminococcaceae bacterium]|nr:metal-dependent transcriptional regulator [Oscillospiraceae bacterium]